jgi:hypothetical protein
MVFFSEFSREKHGAWMQCPIPKMVEFSPKNNVSWSKLWNTTYGGFAPAIIGVERCRKVNLCDMRIQAEIWAAHQRSKDTKRLAISNVSLAEAWKRVQAEEKVSWPWRDLGIPWWHGLRSSEKSVCCRHCLEICWCRGWWHVRLAITCYKPFLETHLSCRILMKK